MLHFLLSPTTFVPLRFIGSLVGGLPLYNAPPICIVAIAYLMLRRGYYDCANWKLTYYLAGFLLIGLIGVFTWQENDPYLARNVIAYITAMATVYFLYHESLFRDVLTLRFAKCIVIAYAVLLVIVFAELAVFHSAFFYGVVNMVFSASGSYVINDHRMPYYSIEPSFAGNAILVSLLPFVGSAWSVQRTFASLLWLLVTTLIAVPCGSLMALVALAMGIACIFVRPRWIFFGACCFTAFQFGWTVWIAQGLNQQSASLMAYFGTLTGYNATLDQSIESSSGIERFGPGILAMAAFLDHPVVGLGVGGFSEYILDVAPVTHEGVSDKELQLISFNFGEESQPTARIFVQRIAAEFGLAGLAMFCFGLVWIYRHARRIEPIDRQRAGELFLAGAAMLLTFANTDTFLNPAFMVVFALGGAVDRLVAERDQVILPVVAQSI